MTDKGIFFVPVALTLACGSTVTPIEPQAPTPVVEKAEAEESALEAEAIAPRAEKVEPRKLGDYFVYRYSGGFTSEPLTLTEQVVAEEFGLLVVDFVLEQGDSMEALRVRMSPAGRVVSVNGLGAEGEEPATIADYHAMMKKTQLVPDSNEERIGAETSTCLVGQDEEVDCTTTSFLVRVDDADAVLSVTKSQSLPGRDLSGEILGPDGSVMYRAQLVERGNQEPAADAVAWAGKSLRFTPPSP